MPRKVEVMDHRHEHQKATHHEQKEKKQRLNPGVLKPGFDPGAIPSKEGDEDHPESSIHDVEKAISGGVRGKKSPKGGLEFDEKGAHEKPPRDIGP